MSATSPGDDRDLPPRKRWDRRYRDQPRRRPGAEAPHPFLIEQAQRLPARGRSLDVACGLGRNALWLAASGLDVVAVDVSPVACDRLRGGAAALQLPVTVLCRDLEQEPLPDGPFDLIVNTLYLQRDLVPAIERTLAPGGLLLFATFVEGGLHDPPLVHKEFLLRRGELAEMFSDLETLVVREDPPGTPRALACLVARRSR